MWIKDIRNYDVEIYNNDELVYKGNVDEVPQELKECETSSISMAHKKLIINLKQL